MLHCDLVDDVLHGFLGVHGVDPNGGLSVAVVVYSLCVVFLARILFII